MADGAGVAVPLDPRIGVPSPPGGIEIEVRDVEFSYFGNHRLALDGATFTVPAGRTLALVGPSGAGKTTAAHLLMRFWDPGSGVIRFDGHDLREYRLDDLRDRVALVTQDTYLFNETLRSNILLARPEATEAELADAVRRASLDAFVEALPDGLETRVGERGVRLSGGQRQRVAIARAFLKDAPVLILDEATSHLDAVNEQAVRHALEELMSDRTTIVIAHRLSTVRNANRIVVLDAGRTEGSGEPRRAACQWRAVQPARRKADDGDSGAWSLSCNRFLVQCSNPDLTPHGYAARISVAGDPGTLVHSTHVTGKETWQTCSDCSSALRSTRARFAPRSARAECPPSRRRGRAGSCSPTAWCRTTPETGAVVEGDIRVQTRRVLETLRDGLERAGTGFDHVVLVQSFIKNMDDWPAYHEVYLEFFDEHRPPPRYTVTADLAAPELLIEIQMIAAVPDA